MPRDTLPRPLLELFVPGTHHLEAVVAEVQDVPRLGRRVEQRLAHRRGVAAEDGVVLEDHRRRPGGIRRGDAQTLQMALETPPLTGAVHRPTVRRTHRIEDLHVGDADAMQERLQTLHVAPPTLVTSGMDDQRPPR